MQSIRCQHCKGVQPIENFHKNKNKSNGVDTLCKSCKKEAYLRRSREIGRSQRVRKNVGSITEIRCNRCGAIKNIEHFYTMKDKKGGRIYRPTCKICEQQFQKKYKDLRAKTQPKLAWAHRVLGGITSRTKETGIYNDITIEQLMELNKQNNCVYCDTEVDYSARPNDRRTASTDRLIPKLGYNLKNLVIACIRCNWIKNEAAPEEIIRVGTRLAEIIKIRKL